MQDTSQQQLLLHLHYSSTIHWASVTIARHCRLRHLPAGFRGFCFRRPKKRGATTRRERDRRRHQLYDRDVPWGTALSNRQPSHTTAQPPKTASPQPIVGRCHDLSAYTLVFPQSYSPSPTRRSHLRPVGFQGTTGRRRLWTRFQRFTPVPSLSGLTITLLLLSLPVWSRSRPSCRHCILMHVGEGLLTPWRASQ